MSITKPDYPYGSRWVYAVAGLVVLLEPQRSRSAAGGSGRRPLVTVGWNALLGQSYRNRHNFFSNRSYSLCGPTQNQIMASPSISPKALQSRSTRAEYMGYDIGLFHLSSPVGCNDCIAQRYTGTKEVGGVGTMVGFGMTGTGSSGATTFDGLKRAGQNMIDAVLATGGRTNRILLADFDSGLPTDNNFGGSSMLALEAMIGPGDSGGGLFETFDGQE